LVVDTEQEAVMARVELMPRLSSKNLADDVRRAKAEATSRFRELRAARFNPEAEGAVAELRRLSGGFFKFYDGEELDDAHAGIRGVDDLPGRKRAYYLECRVGEAHVGDPRRAGSRRLVLKVDSLRVKRIFLTDGHYTRGSWAEIDVG
jgi:guanyl-specific ribonuclease Sa